MPKLKEVLTEQEISRLRSTPLIDINKEISQLTLNEINNLSFRILSTEYKGRKMPNIYLAAETIRILQNRAFKLKLEIF